MTSLWQDLRVGARMLAKRPGFTIIIVVALALGVGVNTVVFSAVSEAVFRPLPVRDPGSLISIFSGGEADPSPRSQLAWPEYRDLEGDHQVFDQVIATHLDQYAFSSDAGPRGQAARMASGELVSGNYFDVLGVPARLGRTFSAAEGNDPAADATIVISDGLWRRRFGSDPAILGKKVTLNGHPLTVIGVMPPRFKGLLLWQLGVDFWYPLALRPRIEPGNDGWLGDRGRREVSVFARLRPGATLAQADARIVALGESLARQFPRTNAGLTWHAVSEIEGRFGTGFGAVRRANLLALALGALVLLICCANVANLLLARATGRVKELGIRLALGAGRARIVRQLMTESLLLALLGGGLGLVVASWLPALLHLFVPPVQFGFTLDVNLDPVTIAWTLGVSLVAGLVFGSLPAWRASQANLVTALKTDLGAEGQRLRRSGLRQALVMAQIAISVVVVLTGGLIARSLQKLKGVDPGFRTETLVQVEVNPGLFSNYGAAGDPQMRAYFDELGRRLERLPGVRSVSSTGFMPLVNVSGLKGPVVREGDPQPPPNQGTTTGYSLVFQRYFETVGTELLQGRDFQPGERVGTPTAVIVNAELARRLFGSPAEAIGKRFHIGDASAPSLQIVGVARDGHYRSLFEPLSPWIYLPGCPPQLECEDVTYRSMLVRAASPRDMPAIAAGARAEVARLDPRIPIEFVLMGEEHLDIHLYPVRLSAGLGAMLALLALGLATLGVYSVMTYAVSQRTKEIGIRIALGGRVRDVVALVMKQGLSMLVVGVVAGGILAFVTGRLISTMLFGISGSDPPTFVVTVLILVSVALLATLVPARRAARVSPMVAIRYDQGR